VKRAELQPVARLDVRVGRPIPFPVYDRSGRLLLAAGQVVTDAKALDALIERGLYANPRWGTDGYVREANGNGEDDKGPETQPGAGFLPPPDARAQRKLRANAAWRVLKVWPEGGSAEDAMSVKLIGVNEGKTLVITAPERDGKLAFVKEGNLYNFRGFSGELVYEFKAAVHKTRFEPYPYLHVDWPQDWQVSKRRLREARRVTVDVPCILYPDADSGDGFAKGAIVDLSTGGASVQFKDRVPPLKDKVRLAFRLQVAGQMVLFEATCTVMRAPDPAATEPSVGLKFDNLSDVERLALHAYVYLSLIREIEVPLYAE
jgi:c-di-GMP-binding flagellar brake protein YcgR